MSFPNQITQGDQLVATAIESADYVPGVSGWRIARDGSAEFAGVSFQIVDGAGDVLTTLTSANGRITLGTADGVQIYGHGVGVNSGSDIEFQMDGDHGGQWITMMNDGSGPALINGNGNGKLHWTNSGTFIDGMDGAGALTNRIVVASAQGGTSYLRAYNADGTLGASVNVKAGGAGVTIQSAGQTWTFDAGTQGWSRIMANNADLQFGQDGVSPFLKSEATYGRTSSAAANVTISTAGVLARSTSATKYKAEIRPADYGTAILDVQPSTWIDRAELQQAGGDPAGLSRYPGLIAEDLAAVGLDAFVVRDDAGEIEGIMYDRIAVTLIPLLRDALNRIAALEEKETM